MKWTFFDFKNLSYNARNTSAKILALFLMVLFGCVFGFSFLLFYGWINAGQAGVEQYLRPDYIGRSKFLDIVILAIGLSFGGVVGILLASRIVKAYGLLTDEEFRKLFKK